MKHDARVAIHAALTVVMAWLSVVLAAPPSTFALSPSFAVMAALASEDTWALLLAIVATIGLVGIYTPHRGARLVSVLILSTAHGVLAICFAVAAPNSTGMAPYGTLALLGYYLAYRRTIEGV